ncbi:MAG: HAD family hydrolase [Nevskiaceae bacterium]|nr:MAG: HAD family hydrolase [Nevskiaceae bacterium]
MEPHLFTDADNTLWDTDAVFAAAQLDMLRQVESVIGREAPPDEDRGLAYVRRLDQKIASRHPDHLRYPPALLARGLAIVLQGRNIEEALALISGPEVRPDQVFESAQSRFLEAVRSLPPLRKGVREGLLALSDAAVPVTIVTEEKAVSCRKFLAGHSLEHLIDDIVSVRKTSAAYVDLRRRVGSARCFMVGDQVDRDILAATAAGYSTFYFPGGFSPYWNADLDIGEALRVDRYDAIVPDILAERRRLSA